MKNKLFRRIFSCISVLLLENQFCQIIEQSHLLYFPLQSLATRKKEQSTSTKETSFPTRANIY